MYYFLLLSLSFCPCLFLIGSNQVYFLNLSQTTYFYPFKQFVLFDWWLIGDRAFSVAASKLWDKLPLHMYSTWGLLCLFKCAI